MQQRQYENYGAYLLHQRTKTVDPKLRAKLRERWAKDVKRFGAPIGQHLDVLPAGGRVICLGARLGAEVQAWRNAGFDAIGIDLVPAEPLVTEGDFHKIPFEAGEFDVAYCNCVDHVLDFEKFAEEVGRVLARPGWLLSSVALMTMRKFEATRLESLQELLAFFGKFRLLRKQEEMATAVTRRVEILLRIDGDD